MRVRRPTRREGRSPVSSALGLYFALLATFVVILIADGARAQLFVDGLDAAIVLVWVLIWRAELRPILQPPKNPAWWALAPAVALGSFAVTSLYARVVNGAFDAETEAYSEMFLSEGLGWHWVVLSICIQPALVEEFAFRGVIQQALQRVMSTREVIVVSALMFTVLHINVLSFPTLFMIGVILAWIRIRSGSIWPCVLLHFCHNGLVILEEAHGPFL